MKIAIVGTGVAGLGAAYVLSRSHDVELFEAGERVGGHVNTVDCGAHHVDTGFIVHNRRNYPLLIRLFRELGVETQRSTMSFSVECACGVAWSSQRPWRTGRLLPEIVRFLRTATTADTDGKSWDRFIDDEGYSNSFRWHFAVPMTSALWSTAPGQALDFPAAYAVAFFRSHGMLGFRRHTWRTVVGGSRRYVEALLDRIRGPVHRAAPVEAVTRREDCVELRVRGETRVFDGVVLAVHAPDALRLLTDPSDTERAVLGPFVTTANEAVLHTDERLLPRRRSDRASWNYQSPGCGTLASSATLTYSSNRLQSLSAGTEYCVTLNRTDDVDPERILRVIPYAHPQVTFASMAAQARVGELNGPRRTAFCGAWQGNGFHEDGLASGVRAAEAFGARW